MAPARLSRSSDASPTCRCSSCQTSVPHIPRGRCNAAPRARRRRCPHSPHTLASQYWRELRLKVGQRDLLVPWCSRGSTSPGSVWARKTHHGHFSNTGLSGFLQRLRQPLRTSQARCSHDCHLSRLAPLTPARARHSQSELLTSHRSPDSLRRPRAPCRWCSLFAVASSRFAAHPCSSPVAIATRRSSAPLACSPHMHPEGPVNGPQDLPASARALAPWPKQARCWLLPNGPRSSRFPRPAPRPRTPVLRAS